jgi:hypothetical protein
VCAALAEVEAFFSRARVQDAAYGRPRARLLLIVSDLHEESRVSHCTAHIHADSVHTLTALKRDALNISPRPTRLFSADDLLPIISTLSEAER